MSFDNIMMGYESIHTQNDLNFIQDITKITDILLSDMRILLNNKPASSLVINKITKIAIDNVYDKVSDILTNRFNFNIKVKHKKSDNVIYSIYPDYNYTNVINAVTNFDKMYSGRNSILFNITTDKLTKQAIDSMDILRKAIDKDLLSIDMTNAKIYGMENTVMNIFVDITKVLDKNITSLELTSLLLKEIGIFFKDISKINSTYSNNQSLLNSLRKMNPSNLDKDKLKIILNKHVNDEIESNNIVSVINEFNINYEKDISRVIDANDKSELDFVVNFNLGDTLTSATVKVHTIKHNRELKSILGDSSKLILTVVMIYITVFTLLILNIFIGVGALLVLGFNALLLFISIAFKSTFNMFSLVFGSDNSETLNILSVVKDIEHIKRELISSLRSKDIDRKRTMLQIDNIGKILNTLNTMYEFNNKLESKNKLYREDSTLIENLNGNDLHYLAEKIKE